VPLSGRSSVLKPKRIGPLSEGEAVTLEEIVRIAIDETRQTRALLEELQKGGGGGGNGSLERAVWRMIAGLALALAIGATGWVFRANATEGKLVQQQEQQAKALELARQTMDKRMEELKNDYFNQNKADIKDLRTRVRALENGR